jgi:hypothetical protein
MKSLLALLAVLSLGLGVAACGGSSRGAGSASRVSSNAAATGGATPAVGSFKGDEDDDDEESKTGGSSLTGDSDNDSDKDYQDNAHKGYHDKDDGIVLNYGTAASAAEERELAAFVERYHAAAAAEDGATACSMMASSLASSVPEDYGRAPGPAYLRGAKTCPAVMRLVFKHDHEQLAAAAEVTGVRVKGERTLVMLGSTMAPASYCIVVRERGVWKIENLLPSPLP